MNTAKNFSLFTVVLLWATLVGAIVYSHVVFLPPYLHHLPESTSLLRGPYAVVEEHFWKAIHPVLILSLLVAMILNWKVPARRKYMLVAVVIYVITLVVTFNYFVPELMAFAQSHTSSIPAEEWLERGARWERLSWIRGGFMYVGFTCLLWALTKNVSAEVKTQRTRRKEAVVA